MCIRDRYRHPGSSPVGATMRLQTALNSSGLPSLTVKYGWMLQHVSWVPINPPSPLSARHSPAFKKQGPVARSYHDVPQRLTPSPAPPGDHRLCRSGGRTHGSPFSSPAPQGRRGPLPSSAQAVPGTILCGRAGIPRSGCPSRSGAPPRTGPADCGGPQLSPRPRQGPPPPATPPPPRPHSPNGEEDLPEGSPERKQRDRRKPQRTFTSRRKGPVLPAPEQDSPKEKPFSRRHSPD